MNFCRIAALALILALPCAEAATITLTGSGDATNAGGTFTMSIRNNETFGSQSLALGSSSLILRWDWDNDWLWSGFQIPSGAYVEDYHVHRTVPYRTAPSSGWTSGTRTFAVENFYATMTLGWNDYLFTASGTWTLGNGAPAVVLPPVTTPAAVPDGGNVLAMSGAVFGLMGLAHYRRRGGFLSR